MPYCCDGNSTDLVYSTWILPEFLIWNPHCTFPSRKSCFFLISEYNGIQVCSPQQNLPSVQLCYCLLWMACSFVPSKQQRHDTILSMWTFSCDWFNLYTVVSNGLAGSQDGNVSLSTTMGWLLQHLSSPDKKSLMTCRLLIQHHHQVKVLTVQHFDLWPNTCKTNDITIYWFPSIIFTTLLLKGSWAAGWSQLTFGRTDC